MNIAAARRDQNPEGLTWEEWSMAAALVPRGAYAEPFWLCEPKLFRKERKAWREGVDPTDWKADGR